ncbi:MAG: hypothetical protein EPO51_27385 [Phenylobacterium sp.]|uniref:hypothetical protein n=1 Tax=Phenylobacterium sp. TaxID=1871053 RepID=UPI001215AC6C|nr:hypothetical protein [Phenylobacterium sp.]TAJ68604.1 MAG: hypothetical protein EPO51_27385 [Phenylobacterium sp.]
MSSFAKSAIFALALTFVGGAALAAEECCCCKDGEKKMECCDKMKDKAAAHKHGEAKPGETKPAQPEHQHQH